jgi:tetratricopeptide (TPR) repeat protein
MTQRASAARSASVPILLLGCAALLHGCATLDSGASFVERTRIQIHERGLDPDVVAVPFETTDEMRRWARATVTSQGKEEERLQQLLLALLERDGRKLRYDRNRTATAPEVWRDGVANCLSFTHLFVGLAREVGLPVYYLRIADSPRYERDGELVVASEHVAAAWGPPHKRRVLDFSEEPIGEYHQTQVVSDLTAVAFYYSNLGAGRIRAGRLDAALDALAVATRLDPELADGWVNQGVALRAGGRRDEAEAAFRRALEANPSMISAYNNLGALLREAGRDEEARRLLEVTDRRANHDPFSYLALGDLSLAEGRLEEAARFYRRALRLHPGRAEPLAALGRQALAAGERRAAERWLRKARQADPVEPRTAELRRLLEAALD